MRINRDAPPPGVQNAVRRNVILLLDFVVLVAGGWWFMRERSVPVAQVATVATSTADGAGGGSGALTRVTANGYVVARTKASVSAKTAGRLTYLGVSEGSFVKKGTVIARVDNADFMAAVAQAEANIAAAEATLIEVTSDRDQWGEAEQMQSAMRGGGSYQSVTFRLKDAAGFDEARRSLEDDRRLQVGAHRESKFYADQSRLLSTMLRFLAVVITGIMSVGAIFGAVNTMYASRSASPPRCSCRASRSPS